MINKKSTINSETTISTKIQDTQAYETAGDTIIESTTVNNNDDDSMQAFMQEFQPSQSKSISRNISKPGVLSIVNPKNNTRVIILSKALMEGINNPKEVQVALGSTGIALAERLPNCASGHKIGKNGKRDVIYCAPLIQEIADKYALDYSDRSCLTFHEVEYKSINGYPVAIIKIQP